MTSHITSAASVLPPLSPTAAWASFYATISNRLNHLHNNAQQKPYLVYVAKFQELAGPMTSLVADFLVNPVIRHARRLSGAADAQQPHVAPHRSCPTPPNHLENHTRPDDANDRTAEPSDLTIERVTDGSYSRDNVLQHQVGNITNADQSNMADAPAGQESAIASDEYEYMPTRAVLPIREINVSDDVSAQPRTALVDLSTDTQHDETQMPANAGVPTPLPEDDGMGYLRKQILSIQAQNLPASEKAQLMHRLFVEKYANAQISGSARSNFLHGSERPASPPDSSTWQQRLAQGPLESLKFWQNVLGDSGRSEDFKLTEDDVKPTFVPAGPEDDPRDRPLGCQHYMRNVKLQCSTCERWYTCRFCHNEVEDHELIRKDTKNMLCMYCGTAQKAGETCVACGVSAARYYCGVCKLWNNDPDKNVYHCDDCGICRVGRGIGKDFFHCKRCVACIAISTVHDHKCFERATDCDCPICGEYMFTSPKPVVFMKCGHSIHRTCFDDYMHTSYKCPICNKSVVNMEIQFRNLDLAIQAQPMPPELRDTQAVVLCNDCSAKSSVQYHWLGLKCGVCQSYNTAQLQIMGANNPPSISAPTNSSATLTVETNNATAAAAVTPADVPAVTPVDIPSAREMFRRRRHSSSYTGPAPVEHEADRLVQNRLARSESPVTYASRLACRHNHMDIEEEDEEDMLGFWSRIPRSITSDDEADRHAGSEDSEEESDDDGDSDEDEALDEDDEDEDDEDDEMGLGFFMPGHR